MRAKQTIQYIDAQKQAIETLAGELDEIQIAFNAQFDEFKQMHDATLDALTGEVATGLNAVGAELRAAIEAQLEVENERIEERRQKLREEYLPQRQQAADELLTKAQAELAELRALNPELDEREETFKRHRADLEAQLDALNEEIRQKSRRLGVVLHFVAITKIDRQRQRIIGKLEAVNDALLNVRSRWEKTSAEAREEQDAFQKRWQLESIAVARLQSELDQLDDEARRQDLALRRATRAILDDLKEPAPGASPDLEGALKEMAALNIETDAYHEGLASVGGLIGLLGGIDSGLDAIRKSIDGLDHEQRMHSSYLRALDFHIPERVDTFHRQWPVLAEQFADEKAIGANPSEFSANVKPILDGPLSESNIEAMFIAFGAMIKQATEAW
jgi:chromosome segregation ATPase